MDDTSLHRPDPDALLARFRATGDMRALAALFDVMAPGLFRAALHLAPDPASAEDALQETFLALLEAARRGDRIKTIAGWLAGTLRNKVRRGHRTEKRIPDPLRLEPRLLDTDPPTVAVRAEEIGRVRAALEDLPEPYREVAILRWRYGIEPAAIAHARGVPPGTVRSLLSRAAERLRFALGALAAFAFDIRPPRGLDAVRDEVLRAAASPVSASTSTAAAPAAVVAALFGGVLVAKKSVGAAVVGIGACLLLGMWFMGDGWNAGMPAGASTASVTAPRSLPGSDAIAFIPRALPEYGIELSTPSGRRVLVRDALTNAPIAGAAVNVAGRKTSVSLLTGADGLAGLPEHACAGSRVEAACAGYGGGSVDLPTGDLPDIVEISLVPGLEEAKAAFIAAAKRREALLSCCRIRSWTLSWKGTDGHLFRAEETITDFDEPRELWVRRDITYDGISLRVDLPPEATEISQEIVDAVGEARPGTIVVFDGERQVLLHPQNRFREEREDFDGFHRRGAIVWSGLRVESAWMSSLLENCTLRLLRDAGGGEWEWLFASEPYRGQRWLNRVRTAGGDQLLPVRETSTRIDEADLEMVVRRCVRVFDEYEPRETVGSVRMVLSTVTVSGLLLPERAGGDAHFLADSPRAFSRYWLQYEPRQPGSWPQGHFDITRSPEEIAESVKQDP